MAPLETKQTVVLAGPKADNALVQIAKMAMPARGRLLLHFCPTVWGTWEWSVAVGGKPRRATHITNSKDCQVPMTRVPCHFANSRAARSRRAFVSGTVVLSTILLLAVIGLALELGLLYHVEVQLQNACDAAALAGVTQLLNDDVLRPAPQSDPINRVLSAQQTALQYGSMNFAAGSPTVFLVSPENDPQSDIVAGWVDNPHDRQSPFIPWVGSGPFNTLQVRAIRSQSRSNAVPLLLGVLFGVTTADIQAEARATLDQRVYGFRPIGGTSMPLVPLAALHQGSGDAWVEQATAAPQAGTNDEYAFDPVTRQFEPGADFIPEIELRIGLTGGEDSSSSNLACLLLGTEHFKSGLFNHQLTVGLQTDHVQLWGGQLALDENGVLSLPGTDRLPDSAVAALLSISGENRIWPLYSTTSAENGGTLYVLSGFAAGRLVTARVDSASKSCWWSTQRAGHVNRPGASAGPPAIAQSVDRKVATYSLIFDLLDGYSCGNSGNEQHACGHCPRKWSQPSRTSPGLAWCGSGVCIGRLQHSRSTRKSAVAIDGRFGVGGHGQ